MEKKVDREFPQVARRPVAAVTKSYPHGHVELRHIHTSAEFLYAEMGTMKVTTDRGVWIVPPHRAAWFPPGCPHQTETGAAVEIFTLYLQPDACPKIAPLEPCVIPVSSLLRELIRRAAAMPMEYDESGHEGRIIALLLDEIQWTPTQIVTMPKLRDGRLGAIERALAANPGDSRTLEQWAEMAGASPRTLARLFLREAGMSFRSWREQLRTVSAVTRLAKGDSITQLAGELGYDTSGAFTAMFRRVMGVTPSQFSSEILENRTASTSGISN